jgi:hypothetical protein
VLEIEQQKDQVKLTMTHDDFAPNSKVFEAISGSGLTWNANTFIQFLADSSKLVPGTAMTVTVPDETGRANLHAYLATLKDTTAAAAPGAPSKPAIPKITGPTQAELDEATSATDIWLYASHDYAGTRFVDLDQITSANAKNLLYRSEQPASVQTRPLLTWRHDVSELRARHGCHRCKDLPRELDLYLAAEGSGDFAGQSRCRYQGRQARARHGRRLSNRAPHDRRLFAVEPARIATARRDYIATVRDYNTELRTIAGRWWRVQYSIGTPSPCSPWRKKRPRCRGSSSEAVPNEGRHRTS